MKDYKIFISYSEDSENTVNRIKKVSAYLRQKGYTVWCYADEPLGVNVVTFMQKAPEADVILVMGSKNYKEKSLLIDEKVVDPESFLRIWFCLRCLFIIR